MSSAGGKRLEVAIRQRGCRVTHPTEVDGSLIHRAGGWRMRWRLRRYVLPCDGIVARVEPMHDGRAEDAMSAGSSSLIRRVSVSAEVLC